jgi:gliding motility-associated-like protein
LFIKTYLLSALLLLSAILSHGQKIIDPCFESVREIGFFYGSNDVVNVCDCSTNYIASDIMQWNGTLWYGALDFAIVDIQPPPGCNQRAIWMGEDQWTSNGEGIGLKLDQPLVANKKVSFKFTYASTGLRKDGQFSPRVYTSFDNPGNKPYRNYHYVGSLPAAAYTWKTDSITFTPTKEQEGHVWLILHAKASPGIILGACDFPEPPDKLFPQEIEPICIGQSYTITPPKEKYYKYEWNTGATTSTLTVNQPGFYSVTIKNNICIASDTIEITYADCEVRLIMPTVFTPNGDNFNARFIPLDQNYLETGITTIYNRWGDLVFKGDLFTGWDGRIQEQEAATGVYYYHIIYTDRNARTATIQGPVTLIR